MHDFKDLNVILERLIRIENKLDTLIEKSKPKILLKTSEKIFSDFWKDAAKLVKNLPEPSTSSKNKNPNLKIT
jgi:DNA-directed RNA polymerase beta' subunit